MTQNLICDLDESLIKTDCLFEQWILLLKTRPGLFLLSFFWLISGKVTFKTQLARHTKLQVENLPYRESILKILKSARGSTRIILASASPQPWVEAVALHLGLFDHVLASTEKVNLKGSEKLKAIQALVGDETFTYIGDSPSDLKIWEHADEVIAVQPSSSLVKKIRSLQKPTQFLYDSKSSPLILLAQQLRVHQWTKNGLILLPIFAAHQLSSLEVFIQGGFALLAFSFCASLIYQINDVLDLNSDRKHRTKRFRPFASGDLSLRWLLLILPLLLAGVFACCSLLNTSFMLWLALYFGLNLLYSFKLKKIEILDIVLLSLMYSIRVFAGSAATSIPSSEWLISFSTLFFFGLACIKRYSEIHSIPNQAQAQTQTLEKISGRGYLPGDAGLIQSLGVGASLLSIVIFMLYLKSAEVQPLYSSPQILWGVNPILLYWTSRVWLLTHRQQMNDDPVVFAIRDQTSWACLIAIFTLAGLAL